MQLYSPIEVIKRIPPSYQRRLLKLNIKSVSDLVYHFPFRYDDFSIIKPIAQLKLNEIATIQGNIIEIKNIRTWKKRMFITQAYIRDNTGVIKAVWFNQPFLASTLRAGQIISVSGKVNFDKTLYLSNPAYERITVKKELRHTGRLVPVYSETSGISSRWLRYMIKLILPNILSQIKDFLPLGIKKSQNLLDLERAIEQIHFPKTKKYIQAAKKRLAFDELFLIQLYTLQQKIKWQKQAAPKILFNQRLIKNFVDSLPFELTNAQRKSAWEIIQDLSKNKPMNRLLEGDVGSGKTVVAAIAALGAIKEGWQAALMAPTEILAQQHFKTVTGLFEKVGINLGLLTGAESKLCAKETKFKCSDERKESLIKKIAEGEIQFLIGTHALIQENIKFKNLALAIVDEQHRFGVAQRAAIVKNITKIDDGLVDTIPHLLSMTATPIPRTLALTIYGDLDISLLDETPKGRPEIITKIVAPANRQKAYEFIRQQVRQNRQVFVICPRIESSEKSSVTSDQEKKLITDHLSLITPGRNWDDVKTVKEEYEKLHKIIFPDLKIAMLHGKMKPKEKEKIMLDFKERKADVLVSTSVVEVGIDLPNATIMMIEGAERFGLAQLHQFRGRVGRGQHQSYCILFTTTGDGQFNRRLQALVRSKNGFELAEKDLALRGPGEFFGTRQWGLPDLSMASLFDVQLVKNVREEAQKLIQKDPYLKDYPLLQEKVKQFQADVHLE